MSGICGILRLDSGPPAGIEVMCHRLRQRGPEGARMFRAGPCALGHTLLGTTPEALVEHLPLTHAETGCTITADCRIDNRDDLLTAFGLTQPGRVVGDGELILRAYLQWGEDCPNHLLGDFAFAIWDPRTRRLFGARDQMGMKQLIWTHVEGRVFAFASEPRAVILAEGILRVLNEARVAEFLEGSMEDSHFQETFYVGVMRLPAAHRLVLSDRGLRIERYWTLPIPTPGPKRSAEVWAEGFREALDVSVRRRLRAPEGRLGAQLSGGMDSGSVVALGRRAMGERGELLSTFSAVSPDPEDCIETRTIRVAQGMAGLSPREISRGDLSPVVDDLAGWAADLGEPFDMHMAMNAAVWALASQSGKTVMLDGAAGDVILSHGDLEARRLRQFRWMEAWRDAKGSALFWGPPETTWTVLKAADPTSPRSPVPAPHAA